LQQGWVTSTGTTLARFEAIRQKGPTNLPDRAAQAKK
jgi:hypothetical protein